MGYHFGLLVGEEYRDERLLLDAMIGDSTLFARRYEVEEAWRIVDSVIAGWQACEVLPEDHDAGSWGPEDADRILDMGPGPGERGGDIVFFGTPDALLESSDSPTARFLRSSTARARDCRANSP